MIRSLLVSARPAQWTKNLFVLVAPLFARKLHDAGVLTLCLEALGAFILVASGVYLVGDDEVKMSLVGLVSGVLTLQDDDGVREYLTVVGPRDLWRLVSYYRADVFERQFTYRPDIL